LPIFFCLNLTHLFLVSFLNLLNFYNNNINNNLLTYIYSDVSNLFII